MIKFPPPTSPDSSQSTKYRNPHFDTMKGIGILLVIIGHQDGVPVPFKHFIYAFHMPLFFILAGCFYKPKDITKQLFSDFQRLVLPYLLFSLFFLIVPLTKLYLKHDSEPISDVAWDIFHGDIGPIWFLLALFWCKTIYNLAYRVISDMWILFPLLLIISYGGVLAYNSGLFNPLSLYQGCSALVFYLVGSGLYKLRDTNSTIAHYVILGLAIVYIVGGYGFPMDMLTCNYSCITVNFLSGVGGTILLYIVVTNTISGNNILTKIGVLSLPILCFHTLERGTPVGFFWNYISDWHWTVQLCIRITFIMTSVILSMRLKYIRELFKICI